MKFKNSNLVIENKNENMIWSFKHLSLNCQNFFYFKKGAKISILHILMKKY